MNLPVILAKLMDRMGREILRSQRDTFARLRHLQQQMKRRRPCPLATMSTLTEISALVIDILEWPTLCPIVTTGITMKWTVESREYPSRVRRKWRPAMNPPKSRLMTLMQLKILPLQRKHPNRMDILDIMAAPVRLPLPPKCLQVLILTNSSISISIIIISNSNMAAAADTIENILVNHHLQQPSHG